MSDEDVVVIVTVLYTVPRSVKELISFTYVVMEIKRLHLIFYSFLALYLVRVSAVFSLSLKRAVRDFRESVCYNPESQV